MLPGSHGNGSGDSRTFIYFVPGKTGKPGISVGMPVSLYLESDPGIICSFTGQKADAFYLAGGIDSFHGQFVDRALQSAPWNRKIQKIGILLTVAGTGILWARDITGERFGQCSPGDEFYPLMLMFLRYWVWELCIWNRFLCWNNT